MATIQIRDLPEATYEAIRRRARADGRSIQAYMRELVIDLASRPTKREAIARIEAALEEHGGADLSPDEIVEHIHAERR